MASRWRPDFDVYELRIEEHPIVFVLDMAAAEHVPVESHTLRLQLRVAMQQPTATGLRSADESEALHALETTVVARLEENADAIYVGRFVTQGQTTLIFYLPPPLDDRARAALPIEEIVGDVSPYEPQWLTREDPEWDFYADFLFPDAYNCQAMLNRRILQTFVEQGDLLETSRNVDHSAAFPTEASAQAAAAKLREAGFVTDVPSHDHGDSEERYLLFDQAWSLPFHRRDHLADGRANEFCSEILSIILPFEGAYQGWEAGHVRVEA
ncbi:MAG: DUF695 domain-containing protein [Polyangiales bacterium]